MTGTGTRRAATFLAATALLAGGALAAAAAPAGAATGTAAATPRFEGTDTLPVPGCAVVQEVELQGSPAHDYMRWETEGDSVGCSVWIQDDADNSADVIETQQITTAGYHHSNWYYDGPGHLMAVCVQRASTTACGPTN
ncbi:hypothetical protein RVR_7087 [Actinacidiphila reveromycinica]|uniref:Uncharacterized protein n=1 Tax=Actinacidiphila reveromycinica TaxID=659352 RepID=A0A7U3VQW4_9ACTN|nr:hypothetical protein [Streptomyces sp. SN-593]BBB00150.1 hypothetical protein RVR_7087 [Streptomyces sp. SN-593]